MLLELCASRAGLLTLNEEELMRVAAALDTRRSLELIRRVRPKFTFQIPSHFFQIHSLSQLSL